MLYLNQLDYPELTYAHNLSEGGPPPGGGTVAFAGCGPCSLCMIVEALTCHSFPLEDCLCLSEERKANWKMGTDLTILAPAVAERFGLSYAVTNEAPVLADHLRRGGMAVANSGGDREGYMGLFTHGGHYIVVVSIDGDRACILDPSYRPGKFDEEGRRGKVTVCEPFLYCALDTLAQDCANRDPAFYLFRRSCP